MIITKIHPLSGNELSEEYMYTQTEIDMENKSIAIFTIGPVQSFIATAKKTKDFWAGSYLLSYLIWQALSVIIDEKDPESIIFPYIKGQPLYKRFYENGNEIDIDSLDKPALPNRFLAILDDNDAQYIIKKSEKQVKESLNDIVNHVKLQMKESGISENIEDIKMQIEDFLEIYWIVIPVSKVIDKVNNGDSTSTYSGLISKAEEFLASRKLIRNFSYTEEKGIKCSICGERTGYLPLENNINNKICGVCAIKRRFDDYYQKYISINNNKPYYPSVIEIAVMGYKEKLVENLKKDNKLSELITFFKSYQNYLSEEEYKVPLLKRWENLTKEEQDILTISGDYFDLENEKLNNAPELRKFLKNCNKEYNIKLNKYYALIYLDGDDMGKWISGELINKDITPEIHSLISSSLAAFSLKLAKRIIEKKERRGKVVYAGGDDLVAFINLEDFFEVIRELRGYFSGNVNQGEIDLNFNKGGVVNIEGEKILTLGSKASISLGACIAHYREPLNLVIKKAQESEKLAKNNLDNSRPIPG